MEQPAMTNLRAVAIVTLLAALLARPAGAADDPAEGDIRTLKVGVPVNELSTAGYLGFACVDEQWTRGEALESWAEFEHCPADAAGLHEVAFEYDDSYQEWAPVNDDWEGTKIAGHPVLLSLLIDDAGMVQGIRAVTDPESRMYMKKKAFLLGIRVMGRYGRDGWSCSDRPGVAGRSAVGGMYIDRHCEKDLGDRRILLDTALYRDVGQTGEEFTGRTGLEIMHKSGG
jgi:hypothetical protein